MEEKSVHALVESAERALGLAVLLARVRAGQAEHRAVASEQGADGEVVKLASVVSIERENWTLKLGMDICIKCSKHTDYIRFVAKRECPYIVGTAINDH